jgi:hypothetical protein
VSVSEVSVSVSARKRPGIFGMTMRGRATREAPVRAESRPTESGSDGASPYRDLAMATEIGWRPAPNGEPGMGVRTPFEAIR